VLAGGELRRILRPPERRQEAPLQLFSQMTRSVRTRPTWAAVQMELAVAPYLRHRHGRFQLLYNLAVHEGELSAVKVVRRANALVDARGLLKQGVRVGRAPDTCGFVCLVLPRVVEADAAVDFEACTAPLTPRTMSVGQRGGCVEQEQSANPGGSDRPKAMRRFLLPTQICFRHPSPHTHLACAERLTLFFSVRCCGAHLSRTHHRTATSRPSHPDDETPATTRPPTRLHNRHIRLCRRTLRRVTEVRPRQRARRSRAGHPPCGARERVTGRSRAGTAASSRRLRRRPGMQCSLPALAASKSPTL
jgi:hypothetical protein